MKDPIFLSLGQVKHLHERAISTHGGTLGVRDLGGVEGAIDQPKNVFYYGGGDLFDIAAAYAFHIAEGQYFLDGNKRVAIASALTFLRMNGVELTYSEETLYDYMIGIAEKRSSKADLAKYFRESSSGK